MSVIKLSSSGAQPSDVLERCPTCDQPIPHETSPLVQRRIAERAAQEKSALRAELEAERRETEARLKSEIEALKSGSTAAIERAVAEARASAERGLSARLAEAEAARDQAVKLKAELERQSQAVVEQRLAEERERLQREMTAAVHAEQVKSFEEKQKLLAKTAELQRQLESKTAQEIGEPAEADLYDLLKSAFPEDRITRVEKGAAGADVIHDVYLNGRMAGRIVYDSKNRSAWRSDYVVKLRADQLEAKADHAVLASKVFPAGKREVHLQDGVLIIAPGRVQAMAELLRKQVIQMFTLKASNEARAQKTDALYAFMISERCKQLLQQVDTQSDELIDLDRKEERAHQATWKRRGELLKVLQRAHGDLTFEIDRIIGVAGNRNGDAED
ncbi:MAG: DUF2130 domain-containing protein [Hyphomicrobium sp.]|nr:DUF2130 domain-containing protein [Hyphomicrobium sp.]